MESVFSNPAEVKALIEKGMDDKLEEGEMDQLEFDQMIESLEEPTPKAAKPPIKFELRGEGGSGEPKIEGVKGVAERRLSEEERSWELGEEVGSKDNWEEAREGDERSGSTSLSDQVAIVRKEMEELKLYMDEQARSISAVIAPLSSRVQQLETAIAPSIPIARMGNSHTRVGSGGGQPTSPPRATKSGVGIPRLGSPGPVVSKSQVEAFYARNRNYPSLTGVRTAKLNQLQTGQGLNPKPLHIGVSDWTAEKIYQILCQAHEQT